MLAVFAADIAGGTEGPFLRDPPGRLSTCDREPFAGAFGPADPELTAHVRDQAGGTRRNGQGVPAHFTVKCEGTPLSAYRKARANDGSRKRQPRAGRGHRAWLKLLV